jgi:hypothetical protein
MRDSTTGPARRPVHRKGRFVAAFYSNDQQTETGYKRVYGELLGCCRLRFLVPSSLGAPSGQRAQWPYNRYVGHVNRETLKSPRRAFPVNLTAPC